MRTLALDLDSIKKGGLNPVGKILTPDFSKIAPGAGRSVEDDLSLSHPKRKHQLLFLLLFIALLLIGYRYLYPALTQALLGKVIG